MPQMDLNILNLTNQNIIVLNIILFCYIYYFLCNILIYMKVENKIKITYFYFVLSNINNVKMNCLMMYNLFYTINFIINLLFIRHKVFYLR